MQKAFTNFWAGRAKYPNFLKLRNGGSAEFTRSAFKWKDGQLWLAKCREPSTVTVRLDASGRWFVSLLVEDHTVLLTQAGANIRPDGHKSKGQLRKTSLASRRGRKQKLKS